MRIEPASPADIGEVIQVIRLCVRDMRAQGIMQWDESYPNLQVVEEDARLGTLFAAHHESVCTGTVCLNDQQAKEYAALSWRCRDLRPLVVHRLCVRPEWQRRGVGRGLMDFAEDLAAKQGRLSVRLDTYSGNPGAVQFYERLGYVRVGQVRFRHLELPVEVFEKVVARRAEAG